MFINTIKDVQMMSRPMVVIYSFIYSALLKHFLINTVHYFALDPAMISFWRIKKSVYCFFFTFLSLSLSLSQSLCICLTVSQPWLGSFPIICVWTLTEDEHLSSQLCFLSDRWLHRRSSTCTKSWGRRALKWSQSGRICWVLVVLMSNFQRRG